MTVAEWQPQQIRPARQILSAHLAQEVFSDYVQYLCPMDQAGAEGVVCKTIPNTSSGRAKGFSSTTARNTGMKLEVDG